MRSGLIGTRRVTAGAAILVASLCLGGPGPAGAEPGRAWTAEVVDADGGRPLDGVVVLAVWHRRYTTPGDWGGGWLHDATETVTGADGRFSIAAPGAPLAFLTFLMAPAMPEFLLFKAGYGPWRFRGEGAWAALSPGERAARRDAAWERFAEAGITVELPPLRTAEERVQGLPALPEEIPEGRMPRLLDALRQERARLGLPPGP